MRMLVTGLLWFSAIGCGLLAGLYFAFSTFIMTALGRIDQAAGISAMAVRNIESGATANPRPITVAVLRQALEAGGAEFLGETIRAHRGVRLRTTSSGGP